MGGDLVGDHSMLFAYTITLFKYYFLVIFDY